MENNYLLNLYLERNLEIIKGKGCYLFDKNGNKYLDLMSNYGVNILGYGNKYLQKTAFQQIKNLINLHNSFSHPLRNELAEKILKKCNFKGKVLFLNSGAEAVEAALKFALYYSNKKEIIAMENSYHGKTLGALSLTANKKYHEKLENFLLKVKFVEFGNIENLLENINQNTAMIIVEPIQGDGGINLPPSGYLKKLAEICKENNIVLIIDEIQSGMGRTGKFLALEYENINPEIILLGKGLANGFPLSAVIVNEEIAKNIPKFFHTSTFGGNLVACQIALKILEILDDNFLSEIKNKGDYLLQRLKMIKSDLIKDVRGKGLMIGIEVKEKRGEIIKRLQNNNILVIPASTNVIRLLPPYIISFKEINYFVEKFNEILNNV